MADTLTRDNLIQIAKELATPIDIELLLSSGILIKRGAWYEVTDWELLPPNAKRQANEMQTTKGKTLVKFQRGNKGAQKTYKKLTGKSFDE